MYLPIHCIQLYATLCVFELYKLNFDFFIHRNQRGWIRGADFTFPTGPYFREETRRHFYGRILFNFKRYALLAAPSLTDTCTI